MTALANTKLVNFAGVVPSRGTYPIKANVKIYKGSLVALDSAGRAMPAGLAAGGSVNVVGVSSAYYDNLNGSELGGAAAATNVEVEFGTFQFANSADADLIAAANVGDVCYVVDDQTVALTSDTSARIIAGFVTEVRDSKPYVWIGPHVGGMIIIAAAEASQVDTLQLEMVAVQTDALVGSEQLALTDWREVSSAGAVGNVAAIGGVLASDTTPVLGAETTTEAMVIVWAAANADIIQTSIALPLDFNDAADATLDLWVRTDNTGGGGIEAASFTVNTSWNNGAIVADAATDSVPSETAHKITATIAAADIPAGAEFVNIQLIPGTHANDPIRLLAARLNFTRVVTAP